jgi:tellurite methyltransferase
MNTGRRDRWEHYYSSLDSADLPEPTTVLADHTHLLPAKGIALDLACGRGGNALLLAAHGLETHAWDYSATAIEQLNTLATKHKLQLECAVRNVVKLPPEQARFDVIVVSRFLERRLAPALVQALRPGGLLYYQTFTRDKMISAGPNNPDFLLRPNELLQLFVGLQVCFYREDARFGDPERGSRNEAEFIGASMTPAS